MLSTNSDWSPSVFTTSKLDPKTPDRDVELCRPEIDRCPLCSTEPYVNKIIPERTIITLTGRRQIREVQTYCPNPNCPGRTWDEATGQERPLVFTSQKLRTIVLPRMRYGLDVILEVGRRFKADPKPGKHIRAEIRREYGLEIPLATLYRHKDRYEALCMGAMAEHRGAIAAQLQAQPAFILIFDATEQYGSQKLYRALDYLSGLCLGTCLLPAKDKEQLGAWRRGLYSTYGIPGYVVSDREDTLQAVSAREPTIPHQICWGHVLLDIWDVFFDSWRQRAQQFLQQTGYRSQIRAILAQLDQTPEGTGSAIQPAVRRLLQVLLTRDPGRSTFREPIQSRLKTLQNALTLVHTWIDALKGVKRPDYQEEPVFRDYRQLQTRLSPSEWAHFTTHVLPAQDPAVQAIYELQRLLEAINRQKPLRKLLKEFKHLENEFKTLRSWLLEAHIRRNRASGWLERTPHTPAEKRLQEHVKHQTETDQKILAHIPKSLHAWQWNHGEPDISFQAKAQLTLQRIITRWRKKQCYKTRFQKAAKKLAKHFEGLLVFLHHVAIPATNQAIETDNGRLKGLWRRSSGGQDRAYFVNYHGESDSAALNFHTDGSKLSPLELLGFGRHQLESWLRTCPYERYLEAQHRMVIVRQPRRDLLRAQRQSLPTVFHQYTNSFLRQGKEFLQAYLEEGVT